MKMDVSRRRFRFQPYKDQKHKNILGSEVRHQTLIYMGAFMWILVCMIAAAGCVQCEWYRLIRSQEMPVVGSWKISDGLRNCAGSLARTVEAYESQSIT